MNPPLNRFLDAHDDIYETALEEIRNGRKTASKPVVAPAALLQ